jgi:hypothetical protein
MMIQLVLTSQNSGMFKKFSSQVLNVLSPATSGASKAAAAGAVKTARVK